MIEELFKKAQNIGVFDEVFSVFEVSELFKAIRDGKIKRIAFRQPNEMSFDIRCVTLCKDCKKRKNNICHNPNTFGAIVKDEDYCSYGEPKEGDQS